MSLNVQAQPADPGLLVCTVRTTPSIGYVPKNIHYAFLIFVFTIPFQDVELPYITGGLLSLANLSGLIFFALYLFHVFLFEKSLPQIPAAMRWFALYFLVFALGGLLLDDEPGRTYALRLMTLCQILGFFWCAADLLKDEKLVRRCLFVFTGSCVILAVGSLLHLPGFVPEVDERIRALGMNPNRSAALMVYASIILTASCLNEKKWSMNRKLFVLGLKIPLFALLVSTGSRAGIGAYVIGVAAYFLVPGGIDRKLIAALAVVVSVTTLLLFLLSNQGATERWERFFEEGHTTGRGEIYSSALDMISERPIVGWGRDNGFEELGARLGVHGRLDAHQFLLYLLIEVGFIGTMPFLIGLAFCLLAAWKARQGRLGILPFTLLVTALAMMMTHTSLTAKPLWLFLALSLAAGAMGGRQVAVRLTTMPKGGLGESGNGPADAKILRPS